MSEPPAPVIVRFEGVHKSYDGRTLVVRDLTLEVTRGEFLTLLGPSGSGKTTTLMMLAGFESPTGGEILLDGQPITRLPPHRRDIGVVFQNYALFPHLSVWHNVAFPLSVRGVGRADTGARVARALDMVKLVGFERRRPAELSGGQQQRVALARALVFNPRLILLDEPLGALDKQLREQMQYELKQLHEALGVTMLYVTHDQSEALTMSDRIAVFHEGALQQVATPRTLYERPANAFVAGFVGESNRLAGQVVEVTGDRHRVRIRPDCVLEAAAADAPGPGGRALVAVRPEHLRLGAAAAGCANTLQARVEDVIYLGDHARVRLRALAGDELMAKLPIREADHHLTRGDVVAVGWPAEDARAFALPEPPP
jgi:putative spermidine/putrescine transport system ATP-binding protein